MSWSFSHSFWLSFIRAALLMESLDYRSRGPSRSSGADPVDGHIDLFVVIFQTCSLYEFAVPYYHT